MGPPACQPALSLQSLMGPSARQPALIRGELSAGEVQTGKFMEKLNGLLVFSALVTVVPSSTSRLACWVREGFGMCACESDEKTRQLLEILLKTLGKPSISQSRLVNLDSILPDLNLQVQIGPPTAAKSAIPLFCVAVVIIAWISVQNPTFSEQPLHDIQSRHMLRNLSLKSLRP